MGQKIGVIGQGYVGLPIAIAAAKSGYSVTGVDIDENKVVKLNQGISVVEDISDVQLFEQLQNGTYRATSNYEDLKASTEITNTSVNVAFKYPYHCMLKYTDGNYLPD